MEHTPSDRSGPALILMKKPGYESGLSRRNFITAVGGAGLLVSIAPLIYNTITSNKKKDLQSNFTGFNPQHRQLLSAIQMQLFPNDGDGPSANDINALDYLEWALNDPENQGDDDFILQGIGWLDDLSATTFKQSFITLTNQQQDELMHTIAKSTAGQNWLSMLLYYILEALLLDPVYGGNPNGIGWQWLEHQPGFPRPTTDKLYSSFN